jgi:hypothetical protein
MQLLTNYLLPLSTLLLPGAYASPTTSSVISHAIPPSKDPWYTAPKGFEHAAPGTVLRIRTDPSNITAVVPEAAAVYNILFRTTDTRYRPSWAVTTFFLPKNPVGGGSGGKGSGKTALLSYQIPYNSADVDGSPSYLLSTTLGQTALGIPGADVDISEALRRGWYGELFGPLHSLLSISVLLQRGGAGTMTGAHPFGMHLTSYLPNFSC